MLSCQQATMLASKSQETTLTRKEKLSLKSHLFICSACRNFDKQLHQLRSLSQSFNQKNSDSEK